MGGPFEVSFERIGFLKDLVFHIDPVAFQVFGWNIAWYGLIICLGIVAAFFVARGRFIKAGYKTDDLIDYFLFTVPVGIIGARIFYVITNLSEYNSFLDALAIWKGGIAITGGIVFGMITLFIVSRFKKQNYFTVLDAVAPGVLLAQAIGRWGNFFNGEVFGVETQLPFAMTLHNDKFLYTDRHPLFLYECVFNLIGFVILMILFKKKKYNGEVAFFYLAWYGLIRAWLETLRDPQYQMNGPIFGGLFSQAVCIIGGVAGVILFIAGFFVEKKAPAAAAETEAGSEPVAEAKAEAEPAEESVAEADDGENTASETAPEAAAEETADSDGAAEENEEKAEAQDAGNS